jgi:hypothetical protein
MGDRIVEEIRACKKLERGFGSLDLGARPPNEASAHDIGVQGADEYGDPPQGDAAGDEPFAQLGQYLFRLRR